MANTTEFTIEGEMTLAYYANEHNSKRVLLDTDESSMDGGMVSDGLCDSQENLGDKIAEEIGFPNDAEFDAFYRKLDELRQQGLRTDEGVPDVTRKVRMRITVEVL